MSRTAVCQDIVVELSVGLQNRARQGTCSTCCPNVVCALIFHVCLCFLRVHTPALKCRFLGTWEDYSATASDFVQMSPDAVKAAAVRDQLLLVLGGASLSRDEAASLHGKIQNFNSILEGEAGKSLTVAFAKMASGSVSTNDSFVKQNAQYWLEMFEMVLHRGAKFSYQEVAAYSTCLWGRGRRASAFWWHAKGYLLPLVRRCCVRNQEGRCVRNPLAGAQNDQEQSNLYCTR